MILLVLAAVGLALAALPAGLLLVNLALYRAPRRATSGDRPAVSVLIPARDEAPRIERAVRAALASRDVEVEVVVMDDDSSDGTDRIVQRLAEADPRVRLESAPALPEGWSGKQHACQRLAERARHPVLCFIDADVELAPDGVARIAGFLERSGADLVTGVPAQITGTVMEKLVIPLVHFVLLGYLPLPGMRWSRSEAFAAGCGQLMVARADAYHRAGGHEAIRTSFHDGVKLPRAFRRAGLVTDLFDATSIARCRMYHDAREVVLGLAKNAHEGMGGTVGIWVWSVLLLGGHVLPLILVLLGLATDAVDTTWWRLAAVATVVGVATRLVLALRFGQSWLGAIAHPVGVALLVTIQWYAHFRRRSATQVVWKDRVQAQ